MSSPRLLHQLILGELYVALKSRFKNGPCQVILAPFDVKFSEDNVVQPDILVSCGGRLGSAFHEGAPDLVIEILSRSTQRHDRIRKLSLYARSGVPEYWIVTQHPLMIEVLENRGGAFVTRGVYDVRLSSPRFPELDLDITEILAPLPPQPPIPDEVRESRPPVYLS